MLRSLVFVLVLLTGAARARADDVPPLTASLPRPKILFIADAVTAEAMSERLGATVPAEMTFLPLFYGETSFHHLCDNALNEPAEATGAVVREGDAYREAVLARLRDFDVVVTQMPASSNDKTRNAVLRDVEARVTTWVRGGGKLVVVGEPFPDATGVMPCRPSPTLINWTMGSEGATDHPFTRGLPFEVTGSHWYAAICEAIDASSIPLTRAAPNTNRAWLRDVLGGGAVVSMAGLFSKRATWWMGTNDIAYERDRPDDGLVWNAFLSRLFFGLVYGDRAFPVLARVAMPKDAHAAVGRALVVPVDVENRTAAARAVSVEVTVTPERAVAAPATATRALTLAAHERRTVDVDVTFAGPSTDSRVRVEARVLDAARTQLLSSSFTWVPLDAAVPLTITTKRRSYRPGDVVDFDVGHGSLPSGVSVDVGLVDHDGRVVARPDGRGRLVMPDGGPALLSSYWVTAWASAEGHILGTARAQVQLDRAWSPTDQLQWSVWSDATSFRELALTRDAGFDTLGSPGNSSIADRFGLHQYTEGVDINTTSVSIDHADWKDVKADMEAAADLTERRGGPDSRSKSFVSLEEEGGFKGAWGTRYYWPEDHAPAAAQSMFDRYLSDRYGGDVAALNREWSAGFKSFDEIPLARANVRVPDQVVKKLPAADKGGPPFLAITAPEYETYSFFDWYYQRNADLARETYRARRNPAPLSVVSAAGGLYPKVDVFGFGGGSLLNPKEVSLLNDAVARRDYGDGPGFLLTGGFFGSRPVWSFAINTALLAGNTHLDYWVDVPVTFNADLTNTRGSFWTKALTRQIHAIEPILLHRRAATTRGLGLLVTEQPLAKGLTGAQFTSAINPNVPVYSALEESGLLPKVVDATHLAGLSIVVASHAEVIGAKDGRALTEFVKRGGLLISTPWLGACTRHGNMRSVYPAPESGLAPLLGFRLRNTSQARVPVPAKLGGRDFISHGHDEIVDRARDVEVVATYADGAPLVLRRRVGRGQVIYLNAIYDWAGWWNSFYEPAREGFRRWLAGLVEGRGRVQPDFFVSFESATTPPNSKVSLPSAGDAVPWWASRLFTDPNGPVKILAIAADHRSPRITARVAGLPAGAAIVDLFTGAKIAHDASGARLTLDPGEAAFWAIAAHAPESVALAAPATVEAGRPLVLTITSEGGVGAVVDVFDPAGHPSRAHSRANVALAHGRAVVSIPTAENDDAGAYRVVVTESLSRLRAEKTFTLTRATNAPSRDALAPFAPRTSETWPAPTMTSAAFVDHLRRLRAIYEGHHAGMEAKYELSAFVDVPFRPDNRHALLRRLQRVDWRPHVAAVAEALRAGETFYLLGEDLGADPTTGLTIDPFAVADANGFVAAIAQLPGARRTTRVADGFTFDVIVLGRGALVVAPQASADRAANDAAGFAAWHERLKRAATPDPARPRP
ncbi:MAG TPA: beta-galactosidase trimerization domain-containing protein [Polyangia bacterium]|nr:beta-galactosidase trimerization domain-containing protein [Polyangia bacterium]